MLNTTRLSRIALSLLAGLLVTGLFFLPAQAQDSKQEIRAMLEKRDREIKQAIKPLIDNPKGATEEQRQKAMSLINDQIDFAAMGRESLGKYWDDLTEAQRTEFIDVFEDIVRSQSLSDLKVYNASVAYDDITVEGDKAQVKTTTAYEDKKIAVAYLLGKKDGTWWVHDIIIDEVGTVEGYARSFQTAIRKRGFDGLMKSLYKKRDKIKESS